tara:strand:- start:599080 stop:600570 length:1491 start_codon:yes stop_codon:yes gene_type:complete
MRFDRSAGILLHVSSLPGPAGIGDLGVSATRFVDFLESAGQRIWQVLPLGPPALGNSPYSCYSAFAGNPLLISLTQMAVDGWLDHGELDAADAPALSQSQVDFAAVDRYKRPLLRQAFARSRQRIESEDEFHIFCHDQQWWLDDFARFESLMQHFGESNWTRWPTELVRRDTSEIRRWDEQLYEERLFSKFVQFVFDQQFRRLKQYANERQIQLFGDMPIFVAHESADVWANQELFWLDDKGHPTVVAGVPPDYFSETGQFWGNPLYRWDKLESSEFTWWTARFGYALEQFDLLRVDHFRGFESYWEIPASAKSAIEGRWQKGPGAKPFDAAAKKLGELPIIAEDLGMITDAVHQLRDELGFPGMRVMQFGFDSEDDTFHHPAHYPRHSFAYTGTHDNDTLMGWYSNRIRQAVDNHLLDELIDGKDEIHLQLIKAVYESDANSAIVPFQDILGLGNEARMNLPGEPDGNWRWRATPSDISDELSARLRKMTRDAKR